MKKPTIYVECGLPATLVPCAFIGYSPFATGITTTCDRFDAIVRLKRNAPGYKAGEIKRVNIGSVLNKAGVRDYHIRVRSAVLPERTPENTLPAHYR